MRVMQGYVFVLVGWMLGLCGPASQERSLRDPLLRKEGKKEGRKEERKEGRKEGKEEGRGPGGPRK